MRAATVLSVKAVAVFIQLESARRSGNGSGAKGPPVTHHGVEDGEELAHTSSKCNFLFFATFQQMLVLRLDHRIVTGGHQGGHVEHTAHLAASSLGLAV